MNKKNIKKLITGLLTFGIIGIGVGGIVYSVIENVPAISSSSVNIEYNGQSNRIDISQYVTYEGKSEFPIKTTVLPEGANQKVEYKIEYTNQIDQLSYGKNTFVDNQGYINTPAIFDVGDHSFYLTVTAKDGIASTSILCTVKVNYLNVKKVSLEYNGQPVSTPVQLKTQIGVAGNDSENSITSKIEYENGLVEDGDLSVQWSLSVNESDKQYANLIHVNTHGKVFISWDPFLNAPDNDIIITLTATAKEGTQHPSASIQFALKIVKPVDVSIIHSGSTELSGNVNEFGMDTNSLGARITFSDGTTEDDSNITWTLINVPEIYKNNIFINNRGFVSIQWTGFTSAAVVNFGVTASATYGSITKTSEALNFTLTIEQPYTPTSVDVKYKNGALPTEAFKFEEKKSNFINGFSAYVDGSGESSPVNWSATVKNHTDLDSHLSFDSVNPNDVKLVWDNAFNQTDENGYVVTITASVPGFDTVKKEFDINLIFLKPINSLALRYVDDDDNDVSTDITKHAWPGSSKEWTIENGYVKLESNPAASDILGGIDLEFIFNTSYIVENIEIWINDNNKIQFKYSQSFSGGSTYSFYIKAVAKFYPESMQKESILSGFKIDTYC